MADQIDEEQRMERRQVERLLTVTEELDKAQNQILSLEEELASVTRSFG